MNHEELKKQLFKESPELEKLYNKFSLSWWLEKKKISFVVWWKLTVLRKKFHFEEED